MASTVLFLSLITGVGTMTVIQDPPFLNLTVGETARMFCDVGNITVGEIERYAWHMNGSMDHIQNSFRVMVTPNSLTISSVTPNDTGLYICSVLDKSLHPYRGSGTYLSVLGFNTSAAPHTTPNGGASYNYHYLYSLIALVLLWLVVILYWRCGTTRGSQTPPEKSREGQTCTQENDGDDLHYATIVNQPAGTPKREEGDGKSSRDEVEYGPPRIMMTNQTNTRDPIDIDPDNVCYATLRVSIPDTRPQEQSATYPNRV